MQLVRILALLTINVYGIQLPVNVKESAYKAKLTTKRIVSSLDLLMLTIQLVLFAKTVVNGLLNHHAYQILFAHGRLQDLEVAKLLLLLKQIIHKQKTINLV